MGTIDEEKEKIAKERESLEADLALAEEATAARFREVTEADISAGIDPASGPPAPLMTEWPSAESIKVYCPKCRGKGWSDSHVARKKELLKILHETRIRDDANPQDIFNALRFDNSSKYNCSHGHLTVFAKCKEEVEDRLKREVWKLVKYRVKIRAAVKSLEPAPPPKDSDIIWG
jgi:hypothetical protein